MFGNFRPFPAPNQTFAAKIDATNAPKRPLFLNSGPLFPKFDPLFAKPDCATGNFVDTLDRELCLQIRVVGCHCLTPLVAQTGSWYDTVTVPVHRDREPGLHWPVAWFAYAESPVNTVRFALSPHFMFISPAESSSSFFPAA